MHLQLRAGCHAHEEDIRPTRSQSALGSRFEARLPTAPKSRVTASRNVAAALAAAHWWEVLLCLRYTARSNSASRFWSLHTITQGRQAVNRLGAGNHFRIRSFDHL